MQYATAQCSVGNAIETAELLIAQGAEINAKADKGLTPLHNAASTQRG